MNTKLPDINTHFAEWYNEIVYESELADLAPVKGCMVIRPYGFALWENIQKILDQKIKETGHQNAAFPLLIPLSFLQKEAEHVAGFSPELAIVTHAGGKDLEEPLVVRPTSETIIHYMFAKWLKSWRDLPLKINQWCSVVRWEMRTRPFLRTTEFWWQEGHTAHETHQEAVAEAEQMLNVYVNLIEKYLAIPIVAGLKPEHEKFAGAEKTYTVEALMQDGKALQMCTSHIISQSFAQAFDMKFLDRDDKRAYPYLTSWGATTRLIGAVIMVHGDQKGLVFPPEIAPLQIVIVPIYKEESKDIVLAATARIKNLLQPLYRVLVDADEKETPGAKFYKWELKGVPLRIEVGPRDVEKNQAVLVDRLGLSKSAHSVEVLLQEVHHKMTALQDALFEKARQRRENMWYKWPKLADFKEDFETKPGFYQTGWCRRAECEALIKQMKGTIRCILPERIFAECFNCTRESSSDILIAKAY